MPSQQAAANLTPMVKTDKSSKDELFEPLKISDISPAILLFYFLAIPILVCLWFGVLVINSSVVKFAALLLLAALTFGLVRTTIRFFRR